MKYAIRISHLPPCVIYADVQRSGVELLEWLNSCDRKATGPFGLTNDVFDGLFFDVLCESVKLVENPTEVVFTNTDGVDIVMTKTMNGFEMHKITS